jgi:hypothetical protein
MRAYSTKRSIATHIINCNNWLIFGGRTRARTWDLLIKSQLGVGLPERRTRRGFGRRSSDVLVMIGRTEVHRAGQHEDLRPEILEQNSNSLLPFAPTR